MRKVCADCGAAFDAKSSKARFCSPACRLKSHRKKQGMPKAPVVSERSAGSIEAAVRADLDALVTAHPFGESLAAASVRLAQMLDDGGSLTGVSQVSKELRENLAELTKLAVDDADDLADALSVPEVPSGVRDSAES